MQPPSELRDVTKAIPNVILDVRYGTTNNFTGMQLYIHQLAWLRTEPLEYLVLAAQEFADDDLQLVIFDAFRPQSVQTRLRQYCDDSDYVAEVSNHCRGITIDVTLADAQGVYLDMGTDYDDFTSRSHSDSNDLSEQQQINRKLLRDVMQGHGFTQHAHEWWHFDYHPEQAWPLIDDELNTFNK